MTSSSSIRSGSIASAHDRDPLLLPAGESVGVLVAFVGEPEAGEQLDRVLLGRSACLAERRLRCERDVAVWNAAGVLAVLITPVMKP